MTALHARALPFFAIVFAPFLATLLGRWVPNYDPVSDRHVLNLILIVLLAVAAAKTFPSRQALEASVAESFPTEAVQYLRQHPQPGRMFNDVGPGGYLLYELGTSHRVFIDGRLEIYAPFGVWSDYLRITQPDPESLVLLAKYRIQSCLIPSETPLVAVLAASPDWQKVYSDGVSALFVRRRAEAVRTAGER
jgi:hypothetical protein